METYFSSDFNLDPTETITHIEFLNDGQCCITTSNNNQFILVNKSDAYTSNYDDTLNTNYLKDEIKSISIVDNVENKILDYIYEKDKYFIQDTGSYIYSLIDDKIYEFSQSIIQEMLKDNYILPYGKTEDDVISEIISFIDMSIIYEAIDEILNAPITMEEKLAEVGMSIKDFI